MKDPAPRKDGMCACGCGKQRRLTVPKTVGNGMREAREREEAS